MKPGERIRFIKECAESLLTRPLPEAQLILDQFGFQTWDPDSGFDSIEHIDYFIQLVKDGGDTDILALHEYVSGEDAAPGVSVSNRPWGSLPVSLFLSHHHDQRFEVGEVKRILSTRYGIDAFVAHDDIHPSKQWREVIKAGLTTCHALAAFLHPNFHGSQWCDQEVRWAMGRGVPIIPIRCDGAERRDGFMEERQDLTFVAGGEWQIARQLLEIIIADPRTNGVGVKALAEAFVNSGSYDSTRWLWTLLEHQPHIDSEQLRRLEYAIASNRQVYEAVLGEDTIPDLLNGLIDRSEPPESGSDRPYDPPF